MKMFFVIEHEFYLNFQNFVVKIPITSGLKYIVNHHNLKIILSSELSKTLSSPLNTLNKS